MHWATLWHHSDLLLAATSASSQVIPILESLTVLLQFVRGRPGPLSNPGTSQCNACRGMRRWSIRITCPSQCSLLSLSISSILCCEVLTLTSSFVTLSFHKKPKMLLCHLWWALSISLYKYTYLLNLLTYYYSSYKHIYGWNTMSNNNVTMWNKMPRCRRDNRAMRLIQRVY